MKHNKLVLSIVMLIAGLAFMKQTVFAVTCAPPIGGNLTINADCSFSGADNGADAGSDTTNTAVLTIANGHLTIQPGQTLALGSLTISADAAIFFPADKSGQIKMRTGIWMLDADDDFYPASTTQIVSQSNPGAGYRRRNLMYGIDVASTDCDDTNPAIAPGACH
jgi:hypothetical protein